MPDFAIGELSSLSGVKVPTIRYYEEIGILAAPPRTEGNQRRYDEGALGRLRFIAHARSMGFPMPSIKAMLRLARHPDEPCEDLDALVADRLMEVEERIQRLYEILFQRQPEPEEVQLGKKFIHTQISATNQVKIEKPVWLYGYGSYDEATKRTKEFRPLPHFTKYAWQGGPELPDPKLGWVVLNAEGGHPGKDSSHAAIRRWLVPRDGTINIKGALEHGSDKGDGVRGRVVSSRKGLLGEWLAFHAKTNTAIGKIEVKAGETIDFLTDCRGDVGFDSFNWAPIIKYNDAKAADDEKPEFNAKADFGVKRPEKPRAVGPWEKYAQVLLDSNELFFVD